MASEYERLCALYATDAARDIADWKAASGLLADIEADLRIELGTEPGIEAVFLSSPRDPDEPLPHWEALEANADRSWVALMTVVLKAPKRMLDWHGAHFRFQLELKHVMESFFTVALWPGAQVIRLKLGEDTRSVSTAICRAIEGKIRDPRAQGPERFSKAEPRPALTLCFHTTLDPAEEPIARRAASVVPRRGESVIILDNYYRVDDVVWYVDEKRTYVTVLVSPQPLPARRTV
jgi:hypothetical protein